MWIEVEKILPLKVKLISIQKHINPESTDVKVILSQMIKEILEKISISRFFDEKKSDNQYGKQR